MKLNNDLPIYLQIKNYFLDLIAKGLLKNDDMLPSVRDVAISFNINPNTVVKGYQELIDEGYIISIPKKGYFVATSNSGVNKYEILKQQLLELLSNGFSKNDIIDALKVLEDKR